MQFLTIFAAFQNLVVAPITFIPTMQHYIVTYTSKNMLNKRQIHKGFENAKRHQLHHLTQIKLNILKVEMRVIGVRLELKG